MVLLIYDSPDSSCFAGRGFPAHLDVISNFPEVAVLQQLTAQEVRELGGFLSPSACERADLTNLFLLLLSQTSEVSLKILEWVVFYSENLKVTPPISLVDFTKLISSFIVHLGIQCKISALGDTS